MNIRNVVRKGLLYLLAPKEDNKAIILTFSKIIYYDSLELCIIPPIKGRMIKAHLHSPDGIDIDVTEVRVGNYIAMSQIPGDSNGQAAFVKGPLFFNIPVYPGIKIRFLLKNHVREVMGNIEVQTHE